MKFACPNCGRLEVIIGDKTPSCLYCLVPMVPPRAKGYTDLLMSPEFVIRRFERVIGTYGFEEASKGRFKREREAWISAVWALGLRETTTHIEYWIEIETREQTPDCKVIFIDRTKGYNHRKILNVEVVEWDEHREKVMGLIREKCMRRYPSYFFLLLLARNGQAIEVQGLSKQLEGVSIPFAEAWIIGRLPASSTQYGMFKFHPTNSTVEFDLAQAIRSDKREVDFLEYRKRGKSMELANLGVTFIPIP
jgi:hypothetical protein